MIFKLLLSLVVLTAPISAFAQAAPFRGYYAIEQILGQRILASREPLKLDVYTADQGLLFLLGYWDNQLSPRAFRNGQANSLNMLIWYLALSGLADDFAADCSFPKKLALAPEFRAALDASCANPLADANMTQLWLGLMSYDAPEEEFRAWRDFIRSNYGTQANASTVRAMVLAIFMNPYYLIND